MARLLTRPRRSLVSRARRAESIPHGTCSQGCAAHLRPWKGEVKRAADASTRIDPDAAPMRRDDALGDVQAQPQATTVFASALLKAVEDDLRKLRGHADARVADRETNFSPDRR